MTHAPVSEEALKEAGIEPNLIRLSVGVESGSDLVADVVSALEASAVAAPRPLAATGC
jgi:cystathionine beta-lyase/cystathionine gamma-synthase